MSEPDEDDFFYLYKKRSHNSIKNTLLHKLFNKDIKSIDHYVSKISEKKALQAQYLIEMSTSITLEEKVIIFYPY